MRRPTPVLLALVLFGCHVQTVEDPSPTRPGPVPAERPAAEAASVRVVGPIAMDARVEGTLSGEATPPGYVVTLARGARVSISLTVDARAGVVVYGPLAGRWDDAPSVARGGERTELTTPAEGTYLVSVRGPEASTAPFALELTCAGGECRAQCGPELTCPVGASCAVVQCIRAPCPSYCEAQAAAPPATGPGTPGGAMCGTRGTGPCPDGQFCDWPASAQCGEFDAPGTCQPIPQMCTREYNPVCGCDRQTYPSPCTAWSAGVSVRSAGPCDASAANEPTPGSGGGACERGGCGGELCHEPGEGRASICVARPEHACYRSATCERQPGGACGWTQTPALRACLASPPPMQ